MAKVELDVAEMVEETFEKHFGVTLDRLRELAEADKDGRCVVLPCKVGDTVYRISQKEKVGSVGVDDEGIYVVTNFAVYREEHFGRFIFFTHEAAETEKGDPHDSHCN